MNPLFTVMDQTDTSSPGAISLRVTFQGTFSGTCDLNYGLGANCSNLNITEAIPANSNVPLLVNFTLANSGMYCYRINCGSIIAQGTFNYQCKLNTKIIIPHQLSCI